MIVPDTNWRPEAPLAGRTKYLALCDSLRRAIQAGDLAPGTKLLPVREMAYQLGVTPGTVARAYAVLREEGSLTAGVGRGTYVAASAHVPEPHPDGPLNLLSPHLPDVGQGAMLRAGLRQLETGMSTRALMAYPSQITDAPARHAFAARSKGAPIGPVDPDHIVLSSGAQQAIVLVMQTVLTGATPTVLVDELGYAGFRRAAELTRAQIIAVPWDSDGPDPEAFARLVREHDAQLYCTSAEVSNPTTRRTTVARREVIAAIARKHAIHVLDDDCYRNAEHTGPSYRALLPDLGWYVTSPSKILTPALRIGFILGPERHISALQRAAKVSFFGISQLLTDLYAYAATHPEARAIEGRLNAWIARDVQRAVNVLGGFQLGWSLSVPYLWLELPRGWRAGDFVKAAAEAGLLIRSSEDFALRDSRRIHAVRIALNGGLTAETFQDGLERLRALLENPPERITV